MRLSVIGTGYLGSVHAACMADLGHQVVAVDVDPAKVDTLAAGRSPSYEPGLDDLLERTLATGRLRFTTDYSLVAGSEAHFVCVGTPQVPDGNAADLTALFAALDSLAPHVGPESLVVGKSTVPVGTAERVLAVLRDTSAAGGRARLAWNPEFLREGFAIRDTLAPDRLVYGVHGARAGDDAAVLDEVYAAILRQGTERHVMDYATAELVKVAANAFLATKISFINAMAEVCEVVGGDVVRLSAALGADERIGRRFLRAGLGFGGGCLPKDIRAFLARSEEIGADGAVRFLRDVDAINLRRRSRTVDLAREECGGSVRDRTIAVLGVAFKPDSDDIRESPALDVAQMLVEEGADVVVHDPRAMDAARLAKPDLRYAETAQDACTGASVVLHLTEWPEYRRIDPAELKQVVDVAVVVDGRNALDAGRWTAAGWRYRALGRPPA